MSCYNSHVYSQVYKYVSLEDTFDVINMKIIWLMDITVLKSVSHLVMLFLP